MDKFRLVLRDNKFARGTVQVTLFIVVFLCAAWCVLLATLVAMAQDLPLWGEYFLDNVLPKLDDLRADYATALVSAVPVALGATCWITHLAQRKLNFLGKVCLLLSVLGAALSFITLAFLKPTSAWAETLGHPQFIESLAQSTEITGRTCVFYIAVLLGIGGRNE